MTTAGHPLVSVDASHEREGIVLRLRGELDLACRVVVEPEIDAAVAASDRVILDLGNITFCGSNGVELILAAQQRANARGTQLTLRNVLPNVWRIFELTGVDRMMTITP